MPHFLHATFSETTYFVHGQRKENTTIPFSVSRIPAFKLNLDWYLPGTGTYLGYRYSSTDTWQVPKTRIIASFSCSSPRRGSYLVRTAVVETRGRLEELLAAFTIHISVIQSIQSSDDSNYFFNLLVSSV